MKKQPVKMEHVEPALWKDVTIYFTTDGSVPTEKSHKYDPTCGMDLKAYAEIIERIRTKSELTTP